MLFLRCLEFKVWGHVTQAKRSVQVNNNEYFEMDFLQQQIERKRKIHQEDAAENVSIDDINSGKKQKGGVVDGEDEILPVKDTSTVPASMLEISSSELDSRIAEFNVLFDGLSKSQKVAKLASLVSDKAKSQKYKEWLAIEAPLYANPPSKAIFVDEIGGSLTLVRAKLRVWIKDTIRAMELAGTLDELIIEHTKRDLVSLLYKLRANTLDPDMTTSLATVVYHIQRCQYRHANESYYKLSVGNVAWPIGVRNVGIHARSNESQLTNQPTANIMRSDSTRRWITAVKRLISLVEAQSQAQVRGRD